MRFKEYLDEAKLKNAVDPSSIFSDLEENVFFTLLIDEPSTVWDADVAFREEMVAIDKLVPMQVAVDGQVSNDDPLTVVRRKGINYIVDGHHRLYTAMRSKVKELSCYVLDLPDEQVNDLAWFSKKFGIPLKISDHGIVRRG